MSKIYYIRNNKNFSNKKLFFLFFFIVCIRNNKNFYLNYFNYLFKRTDHKIQLKI